MTGAAWAFAEAGPAAPLDADDLPRGVREKRIGPDTLLVPPGGTAGSPAGELLPALFQRPPPPDSLPARLDFRDTSPHPWRRYAARLLDLNLAAVCLLLLLLAVSVLLGPDRFAALKAFAGTKAGGFLIGFAALVLAIPLNAELLVRFGATPGKALLGLRVLRDGRRIDRGTALRRELSVALRGQAVGLPVLDGVATALAYRRLTKTGRTAWDEAQALTVHHRPRDWAVALWLAVILPLALLQITALLR
ncbi:RDD family protein [Methylobacterium organophilum]|uniref:RDD family protein n=1 Tax=Methylobacterium organophilum TaxID=410 RepID=UPI001F146FBB|nr:RDD family protein [Methylobacterium organophilum]UMY17079.1 RDD family protein [Methylobacterium organophilum]